MELDPNHMTKQMSWIWEKEITITEYVKYMRLCHEEHIAELALMTLAAWYKIVVVIFLLERHKEILPVEKTYKKMIFDATNYSQTKDFRVQSEYGIKLYLKQSFPTPLNFTSHAQQKLLTTNSHGGNQI